MFIGFNLGIRETFFEDEIVYYEYQSKGKSHLKSQSAKIRKSLDGYIFGKELDGSAIQSEWFPEIDADIFISHSGKDDNLANALAGWLYEKFKLKCFIDSNVWNYSEDLIESMNDKYSNKRLQEDGEYIYDHYSCKEVSKHVNIMLSIALQKMIDKVEVIIFLNTPNSIPVHSDEGMDQTYSPWIYSEIVWSEIIRKRPLVEYRDYKNHLQHDALFESASALFLAFVVTYDVSLDHLLDLSENNLEQWYRKYREKSKVEDMDGEYPLDSLYELKCPNVLKKTKALFSKLTNRQIQEIKNRFALQGNNREALDLYTENINEECRRHCQRQMCCIYCAKNI